MDARSDPPDSATGTPPTSRGARAYASSVIGGSVVVALVGTVYRMALQANFFNDDFHWLFDARRFEWANLLHLDRYNHFYRPVIEVYFHFALRVFGCSPAPFHALSIGLHLVNAWILFLFARALTASPVTAFAAVLLFCVQPGYVEAVTWVGAITDLLPATWFLLTLFLHLRFLQRHLWAYEAAAFLAFALCLGTHESAVTIPPMMVALDLLLHWPARAVDIGAWTRQRVRCYAPFAVALAGFLVVTYVVNSRSYLVREGHYAVGWHAVPNIFDYLAGLYVGRRRPAWYVGTALVIAAVLRRGTPRMRFFLVWIVVTLLPASFFTWGTASRYLYVPAAGFALLLADLAVAGCLRAVRARMPPLVANGLTVLVVGVLVARFAMFAHGAVRGFRDLTRPYDRFVSAVRSAPGASLGQLYVSPQDVAGIEAIYVDPAAETALCAAGVHVVVR